MIDELFIYSPTKVLYNLNKLDINPEGSLVFIQDTKEIIAKGASFLTLPDGGNSKQVLTKTGSGQEWLDNTLIKDENGNTITELNLANIDNSKVDLSKKADKTELEGKADKTDVETNYLKKSDAKDIYQPKGDYLTKHQDISGLATKEEVNAVEGKIPSLNGYAKESWVEGKGYLTEHLSLDNYYTKALIDSKKGCNTITDLSKIPVTKKLCSAYISTSQVLGLDGTLEVGEELHIIITNRSTTDTITIAIPDTFKSIIDILEIEEGSFGEINIISDGTNLFVRAL